MSVRVAMALMFGALFIAHAVPAVYLDVDPNRKLNPDPETGFVIAEGFETVRTQCTRCHSAKLVTQNRATRQGWIEIIRWMQRTQKLPALGDDEVVIVDYLAKYYGPAPRSKARRRPLPPELRPSNREDSAHGPRKG